MPDNILYLHGRPSSHFLHNSLASSLGVTSKYIDEDARWQDQNFGPLKNVWAWFKNAIAYKKYKDFDFILVDGLHFSPVLARKLGILPKRIKLLSHMGNQLPYFIIAKKIPGYSRFIHRWLLGNYDHIFCEGEMIRNMLLKINPKLNSSLHVTFLGPLENRVTTLRAIQPNFDTKLLITIASGPGADRVFYKGLDVMMEGFRLARTKLPDLTYCIVGEWNAEDKEILLKNFSRQDREHLVFAGHISDIGSYLQKAALSIHTARGDAFPTSTLESMHAGVPVIVSEDTGTKQILNSAQVDLVVSLSPERLAEKINWYFQLRKVDKEELSKKLKVSVAGFTEQQAIVHYRNTFEQIKHLEKSRL